ncbi:hypothetical protein B0H34DRAFT_676441 [Crassisporium funariophilum]|nr:hypothetical protein B0H34DRAFT_676441 [Crassisporium funariophilum]
MWTYLPLLLATLLITAHEGRAAECRNVPGDAGFPTDAQWQELNNAVSGRLIQALPSAKFCLQRASGTCSSSDWRSANFRNTIPGAMNQINFEQDHESTPPSLCLRDSISTCSQGNVPLYAIKAETAGDIQNGVNFARAHNIRLSIKASGHDYLGRSTAKHSLLIHTHKLQSIQFTDNFVVGGVSKGSAVTVGSGVGLGTLYNAAGAQNKIIVGGTAATVVAAGGYAQGGGHSSLSPAYGTASDNALENLEFNVVVADGRLLKANEAENTDLFWALRGGGAGSWGVIVNATFQTYPTFTAAISTVTITAFSASTMGDIAAIHARHIFDWDALGVGQYFYVISLGTSYTALVSSYFPRSTTTQATSAMRSFISDVRARGGLVISSVTSTNINEALAADDDTVGSSMFMGSRLVPASIYQSSPTTVGQVYTELLNAGAPAILCNLVAGDCNEDIHAFEGKVAANANISSALHPAWRTAKTHVIITNNFDENATPAQAATARNLFKTTQLPMLKRLSPENAAYSNEADTVEDDFKTTFYGANYARLDEIKQKYDPDDLFIVTAGAVMFSNANVIINGGNFNNSGRGARSAPGAFHDSGERFDPPKCHPNTREAVISKVVEMNITYIKERGVHMLVLLMRFREHDHHLPGLHHRGITSGNPWTDTHSRSQKATPTAALVQRHDTSGFGPALAPLVNPMFITTVGHSANSKSFSVIRFCLLKEQHTDIDKPRKTFMGQGVEQHTNILASRKACGSLLASPDQRCPPRSFFLTAGFENESLLQQASHERALFPKESQLQAESEVTNM